MCVLCLPSQCAFIGFVYVFVCRKLALHLRVGSQVFAMHLSLWYVVLVCHQYDVCKNYVGSVYVGLSESRICVFRKCCMLIKSETLMYISLSKRASEETVDNNDHISHSIHHIHHKIIGYLLHWYFLDIKMLYNYFIARFIK